MTNPRSPATLPPEPVRGESATTTISLTPGPRGRGVLSPLIPALIFGVLTVGTLIIGSQAFDTGQGGLLTLLATVLVVSAIPLAIFAAVAYQLLRALGAGGPLPLVGFSGGVLAAAALSTSAALTWAAAQSEGLGLTDTALTKVLTEASFAAGGAGFDSSVGLLIAGVAGPALLGRLLPRAVAWTGLVIAMLSMLSALSLLIPVLNYLIPVGRFGGMLWIIAAAALLRRNQRQS
ncbi:DUF4386 domain-containing protein [Pseudonocardia sp.]|jgi:hypothetical protein|uniref:DUF4386 domain-containing protein n=1 Tax=Pseudonocardia sp. TaxID=60912 RepID=UPI0031FD2B72